MKPLQMKLKERIEKVENYHICDMKYAACLINDLANMKIIHYMEKHQSALRELAACLRLSPKERDTITYKQVAKRIDWLYKNGKHKRNAYQAMRCLAIPIVALMSEKGDKNDGNKA